MIIFGYKLINVYFCSIKFITNLKLSDYGAKKKPIDN